MKIILKKFASVFLVLLMVLSTFSNFSFATGTVDECLGLKFNSLIIKEAQSKKVVCDLMKGEVPALNANVIYTLDVDYFVPPNLQFKNTYFNLRLGDGLYVTTLPGATFAEGKIENTGFEELVKTPTGTGTAPYGYPGAGSEKSKSGDIIYKTKNSLLNVSSKEEICFKLDESFLNQDKNQILTDLIEVSLSTDSKKNIDKKSFNVKSEEVYSYSFWTNQATEVVSKGGTTNTLNVTNTGGKSLTDTNSKTTVDISYPSDIELVSLEERGLYNKNGTILATTEKDKIKTTTVEWDEKGSYSGGVNLFPHVKVDKNSTRANGSSFEISIKNFKKTIWNDTPNSDRTSLDSIAKMTVTIIDGDTPEKITTHALVDSAPNWAFKKYDSYNVRLGSFLIKNELSIPTKKKTLELSIDKNNTAIIRGVTIPYHKDIQYGKIYWTSSNGKSGQADPSILKKDDVSALITNTSLGLKINESIKTIKVDLGAIPGSYDGISPMQDILETWQADNKHVYDEFYGWSYISCGVYGSWKKGKNSNVESTVKLYTTEQEVKDNEINKIVGKSSSPKILNGVGNIDKTQIMGGDSFKISGTINDGNWDWNPLQEPVLYLIMPEGFSYSNLKITEGTLKAPTYVGEFEKDETKVKVWKYTVDVGEETRGQYQPDFTSKSMNVSFDVKTNKNARIGTYHINDFFAFTTKDFADIGAEIKAEKWDRSNWSTKKYTKTFGDKVNSGFDMVSLSESKGIKVDQAYEVSAQSELTLIKNGKTYVYDSSSEKTKKETTVVLNTDEQAVVRINVRNNTTTEIDHATLFVPLLNKDLDFGNAFMPEGKNNLPLELEKVDVTKNFEIHYIKIKDDKKYNINKSPQQGDYEEVTDKKDANMLKLVSKVALGSGDGGRIDVTYKASKLTSIYNNTKDIITPVLDYDISGNKSTLTKEPAAISFFTEKEETYEILVEKVFKDENGKKLKQAPIDKVEVELLKDGNVVETKELTKDKDFKGEFKNLLKINRETQEEYNYTVREKGLDDKNEIKLAENWYKSSVEGNIKDGFIIINKKLMQTTPLVPLATKNIIVTKKWSGLSDENKNKETVKVKLYKNDNEEKEITLNKENNFTQEIKNLEVQEENAKKSNTYTIKEVDALGKILEEGQTFILNGKTYKVHYNGFEVTNTLVNKKIKVTGKKVWNDSDNQDGIRPEVIKIKLLANGNVKQELEVTKDKEKNFEFNDLLTFDENGKKIKYTLEEEVPQGYTSEVIGDQEKGFTITNTHTPKPEPKPEPKPVPSKKQQCKKKKVKKEEKQKLPKTSVEGVSLLSLALSGLGVLFSKKKRK